MTFQSEAIRELYHMLPTDKQLFYTRMEEMLANSGKYFHVISLAHNEKELQVIVCISEELHSLP